MDWSQISLDLDRNCRLLLIDHSVQVVQQSFSLLLRKILTYLIISFSIHHRVRLRRLVDLLHMAEVCFFLFALVEALERPLVILLSIISDIQEHVVSIKLIRDMSA